uniref:Uncharacterized protein n=1 Tax=viral metagenome TaxID=1070528 RepID=A0A6C0K5U7_9ZZZZ
MESSKSPVVVPGKSTIQLKPNKISDLRNLHKRHVHSVLPVTAQAILKPECAAVPKL